MISARQLVRDLRPSSASSALFSLPGDDVLPSRHSQPYRASAQPQGMHPRTRHTAREWCSGYPGPGVPGARLRASGTGVGSGRLPSRWFRLGPLLRRSPAQPASPPDHPTPAQSSSASLPDGNASPTAKRQRYSASERPQGKRTPPPARGHTKRQPSRRPLAFPPSASLPVERQPSRRTPAQPPNASATAQASDRKASATSFGTAVSARVARSSQPGPTSLDGAIPSSYPRRVDQYPWKMAIKNRGFCPPFGHFPAHPFNPNAERHFLFYSTSDTPGN